MLFNIKNRGFRNTKSCGVFIKFLSLFRTKCVSFCNAYGSLILQRNVRNVKKEMYTCIDRRAVYCECCECSECCEC